MSSPRNTAQVASANPSKDKPGVAKEVRPLGSGHEPQKPGPPLVTRPPKCTNCEKSGSPCIIEGARYACNSCHARKVRCVQEVARGNDPGERETGSELQNTKSSPSPRKQPPRPRRRPRDKSASPEAANIRGTKRERSSESDTSKKQLKVVGVLDRFMETQDVEEAVEAIIGKCTATLGEIFILTEEFASTPLPPALFH